MTVILYLLRKSVQSPNVLGLGTLSSETLMTHDGALYYFAIVSDTVPVTGTGGGKYSSKKTKYKMVHVSCGFVMKWNSETQEAELANLQTIDDSFIHSLFHSKLYRCNTQHST